MFKIEHPICLIRTNSHLCFFLFLRVLFRLLGEHFPWNFIWIWYTKLQLFEHFTYISFPSISNNNHSNRALPLTGSEEFPKMFTKYSWITMFSGVVVVVVFFLIFFIAFSEYLECILENLTVIAFKIKKIFLLRNKLFDCWRLVVSATYFFLLLFNFE